MAKRDQRHPRKTRFVWVVEVLAVLLLVASVGVYKFDLNTRLFGDPHSEPGKVEPPRGVKLPKSKAAADALPAASTAAVSAQKVAAALAPYVGRPKLGKQTTVWVSELGTGKVVYRRGPERATPASTNKVLTAAAALRALGPETRFRTTVTMDSTTRSITLVGGGDPTLASTSQRAKKGYPKRPTMQWLVARTAEALRSKNISMVRVSYDATLFTGPRFSPDWPASYRADSVVPSITPLWADEGHKPEGNGFVADPALSAAQEFAGLLSRQGIRVLGAPLAKRSPADAATIASVSSPTVGQIVEYTLAHSDNQFAEVLAHHVGQKVAGQASFMGGVRGVVKTLTQMGVPTQGLTLYDGSGLSRKNLVPAPTLLKVFEVAANGKNPDLGQIFSGVPVSGFSGSLAYRFDKQPKFSQGRVRAKTGTLTGVHGLSGVVTDREGTQLAFVAIADRVAKPDQLVAQGIIDDIAAALSNCACRG